jgi:hypothetical protein
MVRRKPEVIRLRFEHSCSTQIRDRKSGRVPTYRQSRGRRPRSSQNITASQNRPTKSKPPSQNKDPRRDVACDSWLKGVTASGSNLPSASDAAAARPMAIPIMSGRGEKPWYIRALSDVEATIPPRLQHPRNPTMNGPLHRVVGRDGL